MESETPILDSIPYETILKYYNTALETGLLDTVLHPFDYAETLIRLGYEPFPPLENSLLLPGLPYYVYYLYSIEGLIGIFKSAIPYVGANMLYRNIRNRLLLKNPYEPPRGEPPLCERFTEKNLLYFCRTRMWQLGSSVLALHAALPLRVLAVRTMARFVGDPAVTQCPELPTFAFLREIFKYRSPCEVFAGSVAKTLREIFSAAISACVFLALMQAAHSFQLVIAPNQVDSFENAADSLANGIAFYYTTPLRNAADISMINVKNIPLGNPPFNDLFQNSIQCWNCLPRHRAWKTADSLYQPTRRYYGPLIGEPDGGLKVADFFGPLYFPPGATCEEDLPWLLRSYYTSVVKGMPLPSLVSHTGSIGNHRLPFQNTSFYNIFRANSNPFYFL